MTTYDKKRVIAGILTVFVIAAAANWHFEFVFAKFARLILAVSVLMMGVFAIGFAPTRKDFDAHRRNHSGGLK